MFVYGISLARAPTRRKLVVAAVAGALGGLVMVKASDTLIERFTNAPAVSLDARRGFETAAADMLQDHPLGIGLNQYSWVLGHEGYAERAGVLRVDRDGVAHNVYWLTAAELGYIGILAYVLLVLTPIVLAVRIVLAARRDDPRGEDDAALGLGAGLLVMALHGFGEWIARQGSMTYLFWMVAGLVAAMARQLGLDRSIIALSRVETGAFSIREAPRVRDAKNGAPAQRATTSPGSRYTSGAAPSTTAARLARYTCGRENAPRTT
jgi:O-antigen ligase